jgi:hypothetical protein
MRSPSLLKLAVPLLLASTLAATSEAQTVPLDAVKDTFLRQNAPNTNEGAHPRLVISQDGKRRVMVGFDLSGINLASVQSATLRLTVAQNYGNWGPTGRPVDVHPLNQDFTEGNGKSLELPVAEQQRGDGSGATWRCATDESIGNQLPDCDTEWAGGDFGAASSSANHTNTTTEASWDVTADVRNGMSRWLVKKRGEAFPGRVDYFSRECDDSEENDQAECTGPQLILNLGSGSGSPT